MIRQPITLLLILLITSFSSYAQKQQKLVRSGHIDSASIFKLYYIPVEVPEGVTEIRVQEQYSGAGKNVLNMGVFDAAGYAMGNSAGFRGWSGGAKKEFFINETDASTGYIAGKINKGVWHILIYASTMIKEGVDWKLDITLISGQHQTLFKPVPAKNYVNHKAGWYRGDLHMHTLHSDGKRTQQELTNEAADKKLDYIISTEHNTNSANLRWGGYEKDSLLIINGEEVTTTAFGHWNAIGIKPQTWIEWRYTPQDNLIEKYTKQVHADGGLCIINHPFYTPGMTNGFAFDPGLFDGIEVWNGNWDMLDDLDLKWWDALLKQGKRLLAIGASDTHKSTGSPNNLGQPQTVVYAKELSQKGIINGLKAGKAYVAANRTYTIDFTAQSKRNIAGMGDVLAVDPDEEITINLEINVAAGAVIKLTGANSVHQLTAGNQNTYSWRLNVATEKYLRVEVRDANGQMLALTNPIWINVKR